METKRTIKTGDKRLSYSYSGRLINSETKAVDNFVAIAYNMSKHAILQINNNTEYSAKFLSMIYGEHYADGISILLQTYESIIKFMEKSLKIRREKIFVSEEGNEKPEVLSGADTQKDFVIIYDSFFKKSEGDEKGLNARSAVLIHEIAHLNGLRSDAEQNSYNSAEALRNLTLLICEIVKPEDLFTDKNQNESDASKTPEDKLSEDEAAPSESLKGENGELPYNSNHHPAGSPDGTGGQFSPKDSSENSSSTSSDKKENQANGSDNNSTNQTSEGNDSQKNSDAAKSGYKSDSSSISGVGEDRKSDEKKSELEDLVKFGDGGTWLGIGIKDQDESYTEGKEVPIIIEAEFKKDTSDDTENSAVLFRETANEKNEVDLNRAGIVEMYGQRDEVQSLELKIKVIIPDDKTSKELETKPGEYDKDPQPGGKRNSTDYFESHQRDKTKEGKITNYDEVKKKGEMKAKVIYERKIRIDIPNQDVEVLE